MGGVNLTVNFAPIEVFVTLMVPLQCSSTIILLIYSPSPVPSSFAFVVKYGSNIRSIIFSSIPPPLSSTLKHISLLSIKVCMMIFLFFICFSFITSSAFLTRFKTTCSNSFGYVTIFLKEL